MATAYARGILIGASESLVNMQRFGSAIDLDLRFCIVFFVLPLYYFLGGSWGTLGPSTASERRVTIHLNMQGSAPGLHMTSPLDIFLNFGNLLYYFWGALGAPEDFPGICLLASLRLLTSSPLRLFAS